VPAGPGRVRRASSGDGRVFARFAPPEVAPTSTAHSTSEELSYSRPVIPVASNNLRSSREARDCEFLSFYHGGSRSRYADPIAVNNALPPARQGAPSSRHTASRTRPDRGGTPPAPRDDEACSNVLRRAAGSVPAASPSSMCGPRFGSWPAIAAKDSTRTASNRPRRRRRALERGLEYGSTTRRTPAGVGAGALEAVVLRAVVEAVTLASCSTRRTRGGPARRRWPARCVQHDARGVGRGDTAAEADRFRGARYARHLEGAAASRGFAGVRCRRGRRRLRRGGGARGRMTAIISSFHPRAQRRGDALPRSAGHAARGRAIAPHLRVRGQGRARQGGRATTCVRRGRAREDTWLLYHSSIGSTSGISSKRRDEPVIVGLPQHHARRVVRAMEPRSGHVDEGRRQLADSSSASLGSPTPPSRGGAGNARLRTNGGRADPVDVATRGSTPPDPGFGAMTARRAVRLRIAANKRNTTS